MKVYSEKNAQLYKTLIAAQFNSCKVEAGGADVSVARNSPIGRLPVMETPEGHLYGGNAIARHVARAGRGTLYGNSPFENSLVEQWIDFAVFDLDLPASVWYLPVQGKITYNAAAVNRAKVDVKSALEILDKHLVAHTYLVGHRVTLADITVSMSLYHLFELVMEPAFRAPFKNVIRWFNGLVNLTEFKAVCGEFQFCSKEGSPKAVTAPAAAPAPKEEKKAEKKKEESKKDEPKKEEKKAEKKKEEPKKEAKKVEKEEEADAEESTPAPKAKEAELPPSSFALDEWKRTYKNTDPDEARQWFWSKFDPTGYSLWMATYKTPKTLPEMAFLVRNLLNGFKQRCDQVTKIGFGVNAVFDTPKGPAARQICGIWLLRGLDIPQAMLEVPDFESYDWKKLDISDPKQKQLVSDAWAWDGKFEYKGFEGTIDQENTVDVL